MIIINLITFENRSYHQKKGTEEKQGERNITHVINVYTLFKTKKRWSSVYLCVCVVCVCMYEGVYHGRTRACVRVLSVCM